MMCEGEFGGQRLPSTLLEETQYYFNVRAIIFNEKSKINDYSNKKKKRKTPSDRG